MHPCTPLQFKVVPIAAEEEKAPKPIASIPTASSSREDWFYADPSSSSYPTCPTDSSASALAGAGSSSSGSYAGADAAAGASAGTCAK